MHKHFFILRVPGASVFMYVMPTGMDAKTWPFSLFKNAQVDKFGKPRLPHGEGFVNWSNSNGECVLAYSKELEVGIDLEFYKERNFKAISKRFFASSEVTDKPEIFYQLWTKKEAYYKCMGGNFFSVLKNDSYQNAKVWNLLGPYKEKHEVALCIPA